MTKQGPIDLIPNCMFPIGSDQVTFIQHDLKQWRFLGLRLSAAIYLLSANPI